MVSFLQPSNFVQYVLLQGLQSLVDSLLSYYFISISEKFTKHNMTVQNKQAIENDRELMKQLVIEAILPLCDDSSQFEDLRVIGKALQAGDELQVDILSGGATNFSYRLFLAKNPDMQLFAKLSFPRALWNPDPNIHYDLERTTNEYKMMEIFQTIDPGSVVVPYACLDVADMKLLVTQWSEADEQWANQFIDGSADVR